MFFFWADLGNSCANAMFRWHLHKIGTVQRKCGKFTKNRCQTIPKSSKSRFKIEKSIPDATSDQDAQKIDKSAKIRRKMTQPHLRQSGHLRLISFSWQVFSMLAFERFIAAGSWGHVPQKNLQAAFMSTETSKNRSQTLRNRGPGPPKSSPEPSKTQVLKDI